jgi:hypothetical protein
VAFLTRLMVPVVSLGIGALLVALPGGCNRTPSGPTTVRGAVTFQGKPLAGGVVVFAPDPERGGAGKPVRADLGPDGRFVLRVGEGAAVPAGWYRVAIAANPAEPGIGSPPFPGSLARPDLSGVVREVKAGRENVFEFAVEVPPG